MAVADQSIHSFGVKRSFAELREKTSSGLLQLAQKLADTLAEEEKISGEAPHAALKELAAAGLLAAPLPRHLGGQGWGTEAGGHLSLLRLLAIVGGGDLALGRLYEGHANALILVCRYGSEEQQVRLADDAGQGRLFGVWNTGERELLRLAEVPDGLLFRGAKTFATGAAFVERPVVTAEQPDGGWQMTVPRMESPEVAEALQIDRSSWHPFGMEASESYRVDFSGAVLQPDDLLGAPGDFYRDPLFRGGAIRFAAVQAGAVLRLHRMFAEWLQSTGRGDDPYQVARLGEIALGAQEAVLWVERGAELAEQGFAPDADRLPSERVVEWANMMRLAMERIATATMQRVIAGVGAHGLLRPARFERLLRDLTMYLRQPAPDATLAEVGRSSLRKAALLHGGANTGLWRDGAGEGVMAAGYFERLYGQSRDPWAFETSEYEAAKYRDTVGSLPRHQYKSALEVGCSIGVLTEQLAARCQSLLSLDVSERALAVARERCRALPQVRFARMQVPLEMPDGVYELILISEVAYYWRREELEQAIGLLAARQSSGGHLLLVHHTPFVPDYPLTGDQVHELWLARPEWKPLAGHRREGYRLDLLERRP